MRIQRYRIATIGVLILTETSRSKVSLFSLSLGMRAVTSRFDLLLPRVRLIFTMSCGITRLQLLLELEI
jgi:hypothetical protein